jgi:hypothetical protein
MIQVGKYHLDLWNGTYCIEGQERGFIESLPDTEGDFKEVCEIAVELLEDWIGDGDDEQEAYDTALRIHTIMKEKGISREDAINGNYEDPERDALFEAKLEELSLDIRKAGITCKEDLYFKD